MSMIVRLLVMSSPQNIIIIKGQFVPVILTTPPFRTTIIAHSSKQLSDGTDCGMCGY